MSIIRRICVKLENALALWVLGYDLSSSLHNSYSMSCICEEFQNKLLDVHICIILVHCVKNSGRVHCAHKSGKVHCVQYSGRVHCVQHPGRVHCVQNPDRVELKGWFGFKLSNLDPCINLDRCL